jgi:23S rRNA (cytidine1920-2'-O)/16S rRNA (cytidine1409-2'-O)-methyltransferase
LKILLPVAKRWIASSQSYRQEREDREEKTNLGALSELGGSKKGAIIALIKPQFEAGKKDVSRGDGVIRDPEIHRQVLLDVLTFAQNEGFGIHGLIKSPLLGPKGNAEFLAWMDQLSLENRNEPIGRLVERVIEY